VFVGLEEPVSCKSTMWVIAIASRATGSRKCSEKNRFSVGCEMDGPPHNHVTRSLPIIGIEVNTPVMTVAPQNDICPHGRTYPRKAVAMVIKRIMIPDSHGMGFREGELK